MTPARPTFGEFLDAAYGHLAAVAAEPQVVAPGRDVTELAQGLAHLAAVLSRYTADLTREIDQLPEAQLARVGPWDAAAIQSHDALVACSQTLASGVDSDPEADQPTSPAASHLHAAAASLAGGRDLLYGHFITDPSGTRLHLSTWSPTITSVTVRRTLLSEIASLSQQAAGVRPELAQPTGSARLDRMRSRLNTARYWLSEPSRHVQIAERREPMTPGGCELLHAIPANVMPARLVPEDAASVPELLDAVVTTAERTRHAAWVAARADPFSTSISVTSWHRIAAASTVASHHSHLLYRTLAERVAESRDDRLSTEMNRAAELAGRARELWLDSAREFQEISTEVRGYISPAAVEATELAMWTGRLAYADPGWTLSSGPSHPVRPASSLAPQLADVPAVVGAIHEASEALDSLAAVNLHQAMQAVRARRVLVPTRSLPARCDVPLRFARAPESNSISLAACCGDAARAASKTAESGAQIAASVGAPSRTLAAARNAALEQPSLRLRDQPKVDVVVGGHEPRAVGSVESRLRSMGVTSTRMLWRADAVDRAGDQLIRDATTDLSRRRSTGARAVAERNLPPDNVALRQLGARQMAAYRASETAREQPQAEP